MDNVVWVIIAAAVVIAVAGIIMFIGGGSLDNFRNQTDNTQTSTVCRFEAGEVEAGRLDCNDISEQCEGEIPECDGVN